MRNPDVLILDEPTRGVDVGAKREIYELIGEQAAQGKAILMISSDLPEVLGISDRVLVIRQGSVVANLESKNHRRGDHGLRDWSASAATPWS